MNIIRPFARLRGFARRVTSVALACGAMTVASTGVAKADQPADSDQSPTGGVMIFFLKSEPPRPHHPSRTSSEFVQSIAMFATSACASLGIPLQPMVEPWSLSGSFPGGVALDDETLLRDEEERRVENRLCREERLRWELDALARYEPLDVCPKSVASASPLVGSSPMIVTLQVAEGEGTEMVSDESSQPFDYVPFVDEINGPEKTIAALIASDWKSSPPRRDSAPVEIQSDAPESSSATLATEAYMPYDVAAGDLKLWGYSPILTKPYCIRSRAEFDSIALDELPVTAGQVDRAEVRVDEQELAELRQWITALGTAAAGRVDQFQKQVESARATSVVWARSASDSLPGDRLTPGELGRHVVGWTATQQAWAERFAGWAEKLPVKPVVEPVESFRFSDWRPLIDRVWEMWDTLSGLGQRIASLPE